MLSGRRYIYRRKSNDGGYTIKMKVRQYWNVLARSAKLRPPSTNTIPRKAVVSTRLSCPNNSIAGEKNQKGQNKTITIKKKIELQLLIEPEPNQLLKYFFKNIIAVYFVND